MILTDTLLCKDKHIGMTDVETMRTLSKEKPT